MGNDQVQPPFKISTPRECLNPSQVKFINVHPQESLRCENRPVSRPASRATGLEMPGIPVQTGF